MESELDYNIFSNNWLEYLWGVNVDEELHFYYDESNNCRKFWIDPTKVDFNHNPEADFVLAGVACEQEYVISFEEIAERFKLQKNILELKSKSLYKGKDFLACMGSRYTTALFKLLSDYDMFIHYKHVNNFFYTIVEIMDSITDPEEISDFGFDYFALKSTFYNMLVPNIESIKEIMVKYHYPDIKTEEINDFCISLLRTMDSRINQSPEEKFLSGMLMRAANNSELIFIQDNEEYLMQEDYSIFYVEPVMKFKKSMHHFDEEPSVQPQIIETFEKYKYESKNYEFIDSKTNTLIQLSDLIAGIIGRMFSFFNVTPSTDMRKIVCELNDTQINNCISLNYFRSKSDKRNPGLLHSITALGILKKANLFFDYVESEKNRRLTN